jgi:integrase/recombinase XerD
MQDLTIWEQNLLIDVFDDDGNHIRTSLMGPSQSDTLFIKQWLHGRSRSTIYTYVGAIVSFYEEVNKPLQSVTLEDFQGFIDSLAHLSPATRAKKIAAVKSMMSFGLKTGYLPVNVGAVVKLPKLEDKLAERIMGEQQVAKMFALENNPRNHAILVLLYRAGLRVSELCNLTWRNLQERDESGQVTVFGKGKKTRHVLLDQSTWKEVMSLKMKESGLDDYVFQSRQAWSPKGKQDRRMDESSVNRIVKAAAKRAGITGDVSPHWMRHAHATHALERGAPITLVKETLGHKSMETTAKYTHVRPNASSSQFLGI